MYERVLWKKAWFHSKFFIIPVMHCDKINEMFSNTSESPSGKIDRTQINFPKYWRFYLLQASMIRVYHYFHTQETYFPVVCHWKY